MRTSEMDEHAQVIADCLGEQLQTEVRLNRETKGLILRAVDAHGIGKITDYIIHEVARLRGEPKMMGLLAPSRLFDPKTLNDRIVVALANPRAQNPHELAERQRGSTLCDYLDAALLGLKLELGEEEYRAAVAFNDRNRADGWNPIHLRAIVVDRDGKKLTEEEMLSQRPRKEIIDMVLGRMNGTEALADEAEAWALRQGGRTIWLKPVSTTHRRTLERHLKRIRFVVRRTFAPEDLELVPNVMIADPDMRSVRGP